MAKKTILFITAALVTVAMASILHARPTKRFDERTQMCRLLDKGPLAWESESWGLGGKKFKEVCKSCHSKDSNSGAPFLYAGSYGSERWNKVFAKRKVECAKNGSWDVLTEDEIQIVNDFLYRNAAQSNSPCG